jgi:hypothetical protein
MISMGVGLGHDRFHFTHGHEGKESQEKEEKNREKPKGSKKGKNINHGGRIITPGRWKKISGECGVCDYKSFKPHANIYEDGNNPNKRCIFPNLFKPKELRAYHIARNHDPVGPPVVTKCTVDKSKPLIRVGTIPSDKEFHRISIPYQTTSS